MLHLHWSIIYPGVTNMTTFRDELPVNSRCKRVAAIRDSTSPPFPPILCCLNRTHSNHYILSVLVQPFFIFLFLLHC